jgi:hypothetical protein
MIPTLAPALTSSIVKDTWRDSVSIINCPDLKGFTPLTTNTMPAASVSSPIFKDVAPAPFSIALWAASANSPIEAPLMPMPNQGTAPVS